MYKSLSLYNLNLNYYEACSGLEQSRSRDHNTKANGAFFVTPCKSVKESCEILPTVCSCDAAG